MKWLLLLGWLSVSALAAEETGQWYDWQGNPVEVPAAVADRQAEAEWVPGWLARERERQARLGRRRWSFDRGWYGYGYSHGGYWFRARWPSCFARYRPACRGGYVHRGSGSNRWCIRVNSPGLRVNWCR
jgi:hypothetical protein